MPAQTTAPSLPPAAQEALSKGVIAAKVPDYLLAIRYFEEARKLAPDAPIIYLNLGLAESKIPGRELRAMAWFGAYLAASPAAANAAAVKEQIAVLDVKNLGDLSRLIRTAEDAAKQFVDDSSRDLALLYVAELWAQSGDFEMAFEVVDSIKDASRKSQTHYLIAEVQVKAGDIPDAQRTAGSIKDAYYKTRAQAAIAKAQAEAGNIAGAQNSANSIGKSAMKSRALRSIAIAQSKAQDFAGARASLAEAYTIVEKIREVDTSGDEEEEMREIATAQAKADFVSDAQQTINHIITLTENMKEEDVLNTGTSGKAMSRILNSGAQCELVLAQVRAGDIASAQKTANSIHYAYYKTTAQSSIDHAQGKDTSTLSVSTIPEVPRPVQPKAPLVGEWIAKNTGYLQLLTEAVFFDLSAHLKSLPKGNAQGIFDGLLHTAQEVSAARKVIIQMLKQQAQQSAIS
ncbi:MAG: hypothetical protein PSW75_11850 [bacterium]|nr:hypothetical protein [bacterium]